MNKGIDGNFTLVVLDGVGESPRDFGNAVRQADTPFFDWMNQNLPKLVLRAHGTFVGMPSDDDMGNSEVGHNVLGSGQVYDQGAKLVQNALADGSLFQGSVWKELLDSIKKQQGTLHFLGLLSDGGVHSHIDHLIKMMGQAADEGQQRVRVHVLLDGRDVDGTSAHKYIQQLEEALEAHRRAGRDYGIASGGGRMLLTMDRYEADWDMVARGWAHHVHGEGRTFPSALKAIETFRKEQSDLNDQYIPGFVIADDQGPVGKIQDGDGVIFFNFRGDRAIEISRAFDEGPEFDAFDRGQKPNVYFAGMMQYDGDLFVPKKYLVGPPRIKNTLTEFLLERKVSQFAISETQKYGHVTYFWNGNRSGYLDQACEKFLEIKSDNVPFEQRPWMKAAEITDSLCQAVRSNKYRFMRVNYANGDMVGHSGDLQAAKVAMNCLDLQLRRLLSAIKQSGGVALITADHGNADEMIDLDKKGNPVKDESGLYKPKTSHTLNPVPCWLYDPSGQLGAGFKDSNNFGLANIASTVAQALGYEAPNWWHESLLDI